MADLFNERFSFSGAANVVVIGLGRFGGSAAAALMRHGHDVMGIDKDPQPVAEWADRLTHVVEADSTSAATLRQLGVAEFPHAIVAIDSDLASSLLTVMALTELEVADIWVKAITPEHGRIARRIGAHHIVFPDAEMSERVAHLISGRLLDYFEFDDGFAVAKISAPSVVHGLTLDEADICARFGVTLVGIKRANEDFHHAGPDSRVRAGDLLLVSGPSDKVEAFARSRKRS